MQIVDD